MSVKQVTVFEVDDVPTEVYNDISELWADNEFGNDNYYYHWDSSREWSDDTAMYPSLAAHLESLGVVKCLIHYWW